PLGPMLVTPDELTDPHNLDLELKVNDEIMQQSNTSNLIFKIPFLISYISRHMSLRPGDIISTGTPPGVGLGMDPPRYLKVSDTVELTISGLGSSKQSVQET
ncbi:MAG: fumarylacetoacetate hydrolase family protein, partial [Cyclobacteriaceae bacterium]|nr:fumarylacetoacetate hydrolase family protein [Cyclobacteriaceae bacterium]